MNAQQNLQETVRAAREISELIESLRWQLRPYWSERSSIEDTIKRTHHHISTPIYRDDEVVGERIDVTGFDFSNASLRAPLFPRLDELRIEYAPIHVELAQAQAQLKLLTKAADHIRKAIEKEHKKQDRDRSTTSESSSEGHRCAQCNGPPDGKERLINGVWLHPECARFYEGEN
jgi:hypothetical protein